jgi:hypothetical protein
MIQASAEKQNCAGEKYDRKEKVPHLESPKPASRATMISKRFRPSARFNAF